MFEHVYAEPPPYLSGQKKLLSDALERRQSETNDG
jgi:hypothetical protein